MGGFECSSHRDRKRRLDLIESTRHEEFALLDYQRAADIGMLTVRDGVRWHLIEPLPRQYDFSSLLAQVEAAKKTGVEVVWDLFHYGYPDDLDIFSEEFAARFADFSAAVCAFLTQKLGPDLIVCPVNEISFFSYIAGERGVFAPFKTRRGSKLKGALIRAADASVKAIRSVAPSTRFMFTDPAIHVLPKNSTPAAKAAAERYRRSQFEALDKLVENDENCIDIIGLNYYFHNQWRHPSRRKIPRGHKLYRPLSDLLAEYFDRYGKPLLIAETGIEDEARPEWFRYVCEQVRVAMSRSIPIEGICLYPIVNHPGWRDDRHCHNGLWDYADGAGYRCPYEPLADEIALQMRLFNDAFDIDREPIRLSQAS